MSRVFAVALVAVAAVSAWLTFGPADERVAKPGCAPGYTRAEQDFVERARGQREGGARSSEKGERAIEKSDRWCIDVSHPETSEDLLRFGEAAALRFGGERPGQMRRALRQRARIADSRSIAGANGTWQPLGKGPLIANDPNYQFTYGESYGQLAGRISDYAYDPRTNRLWATVAQGGVWESTDRGRSWFSVGDGRRGLPMQSSSGIGWTPAGGTGGTLIVVTGDHAFSNDYSGMGAYWSNDDGRTWRHARGIPDGALSFEVAVDPTNARRVYAATGLGLYRSDDAGRSFENVKLPTGECAGDSLKPNCFFANIVTSVQVQRPDKFGHEGGAVAAAVGWRAGPLPNFNDRPQAPANGVYVSDTGDTGSFQKVPDDAGITPTAEFGRTELGAANGPAQNSAYLYAIVQNTKYFNDGNDLGDLDAPACDPVIGLVCPASGSVVDGIYVSDDFGRTWTQMTSHDEIAQDPTNGSSLNQLRPFGISAGVQAWYNEWIEPDPTQADANGVPTRLLFGLEEVFQNRFPGQPMDGRTEFQAIGPYNQAGACLLVLLAETCGTTQSVNPDQYTTHPDQHGAMILPGEQGGSDLVVGNDGGNYVQQSSGGPFTRNWGEGNQTGFHTLMPYGVAMAKDRTVWAGLQDNGELRIDPKTGAQNMVYGGDGVFTLTNPDNSDEAIEEYPGASISYTTDGGKSWSDMSPDVDDPDFATPLVQDPQNYKHIATGGRQILESTDWVETTFNCHKDPGGSSGDPTCPDAETDWKPVFDLGTQKRPGDKDAEASDDDPGNHVVSMRVRGAAVYAGFCGSCDPVKLRQRFRSGIATNVGGSKPPKTGTPDGWHVAAARGLPQRIVTGVEIDANDPRTVYVTLGASAARPFAPLGSLGEDASSARGGYVYVSRDAGESFTDITGNLPRIQATWVRQKGDQLVVSNAIGVFVSKDRDGREWAPLGRGFPTSPVYSFELEPGDANKIVVASFGRGVWEYDFRPRGSGRALLDKDVARGSRPCGDRTGPTSRLLPNLSKAVQRRGRGLLLRGTSRFRKCKGSARGRVSRVSIMLKLQKGRRCRYLTRKGRLGRYRRCRRVLAFHRAKGTTRWRYRARGPLPNGRYVVWVLGRDNIGNRERRTKHRNFRHFRIRGRRAIAGWHGRQPRRVPSPPPQR